MGRSAQVRRYQEAGDLTMCGGGGGATVDAEAERLKAEATATTSANQELIAKSRRKRKQKGLLSAQDEEPSTVLTGGYDPNKKPSLVSPGSTANTNFSLENNG